jgi:hypothetical protein
MFAQPLLSVVPSGVLDMTTDLTPLLVGLVVTLGICVLGLVATIGVHDTRWTQRREQKDSAQPTRAPQFPKAA